MIARLICLLKGHVWRWPKFQRLNGVDMRCERCGQFREVQ